MKIPFAGIQQGFAEYWAVFKVLKSKWHVSGPESAAFEREFGAYIGAEYVVTLNSGSSANLLALKALDLPVGSKVLTSGCGFPATLNPILHLGLNPILVDYDLTTHNIDLDQVEATLKRYKADKQPIRAIIFAHTMGIPVDMHRMMALAQTYNVKVIEDCCEAIGTFFRGQHVGSFGDLATFSFYPSHQINGFGMGGAVATNNLDWAMTIRSMRQWGKAIHKPTFTGDHVTNYTNTVDGIPYDDQYTYVTQGFNMQMPDAIAAYLRVQLTRLPQFIGKRKRNWKKLETALARHPAFHATHIIRGSNPAYFGYTLTLHDSKDRDSVAAYLETSGIRTRPFFAGNITRHTPYRSYKQAFKVADYLMKNSMFVGVWPGITPKQIDYMIQKITEAVT